MEMYGELRPNPSIAIGELTSLYLSYRLVKKINLSKFFDFLSKRKDNSISQQEEPMKKEVSEPTVVKKGNKILFMPKKVFYTVSTLCLIALLFVRFGNMFGGFECSPNSILFNVKYDYVTNSSNTVVVDDIRYNKSDMTLFSGEYTDKEIGDDYYTFYTYNYQNGLKHGYSYVWQKYNHFLYFGRGGYYIFRGKYKKGLKHGLIEEWYDSELTKESFVQYGHKKSKGNYADGLRDGLIEEWWSNGQLKSRGNYKNGQEDGVIEEWYGNGQPKSKGNYEQGKELSQNNFLKIIDSEGYKKMEILYNSLKSDGYYTKSFDEFVTKFGSVEKSKKLYDSLELDGLYTNSFYEFVTQHGFGNKNKLEKLYNFYLKEGIITNATSFEKWKAADSIKQEKLFEIGKSKGLFKTSTIEQFQAAWSSVTITTNKK